jgi:iron only hydrogenase large subunit-like protein
LFSTEQLREMTMIAISRALAGELRPRTGTAPALRDRLKNIIAEMVPADRRDWRAERRLLLSRSLAAVSEDGSDLVVTVVPSLCQCQAGQELCVERCPVGGFSRDEHGAWRIDPERCVNCEQCADVCDNGAIVRRSEVLKLTALVLDRQAGHPLYAIIAPAFVGQFGYEVTEGQVRETMRRVGFTDVAEVALAADILTLREADEYVDRVDHGAKFMITSCCCPSFVKLVEKHAPHITHLISDTVSPMIALGRLLKAREPQCRVVFIGPCLAKRAEARRPDLGDAVDLVLTFKEVMSLLEAIGIDPAIQPDAGPLRDASHDGRIYAHTGGVSEAILRAVREKRPDLKIDLATGNGLIQCREILQRVERGEETANFMEGMGCPGGCLGGPGTVIPVDRAAPLLRRHADDAPALRAADNELAWKYAALIDQAVLHTRHEPTGTGPGPVSPEQQAREAPPPRTPEP